MWTTVGGTPVKCQIGLQAKKDTLYDVQTGAVVLFCDSDGAIKFLLHPKPPYKDFHSSL